MKLKKSYGARYGLCVRWVTISFYFSLFAVWNTLGKQIVVYQLALIVFCCSSGNVQTRPALNKKYAIICLPTLFTCPNFDDFLSPSNPTQKISFRKVAMYPCLVSCHNIIHSIWTFVIIHFLHQYTLYYFCSRVSSRGII